MGDDPVWNDLSCTSPISVHTELSLNQAMNTARTTARRKLKRDAFNFDDYLMLAMGVALAVMMVLA